MGYKPNAVESQSGDGINTTSATFIMCGLAIAVTPKSSGAIEAIASGSWMDNSASTTGEVELLYGTGTAPSLNDAVTGTVVGKLMSSESWTAVSKMWMFALNGEIEGLSIGVDYWFDLAIRSDGTKIVTIKNPCLTFSER